MRRLRQFWQQLRKRLAHLGPYLPAFVVLGFALTPLLVYFEDNISDLRFSEASLMVLATAATGLAIWVGCRLFTGTWQRAAILAALLTIPFFQFKGIGEWFEGQLGSPPERSMYVLSIAILVLGTLLLRRTRPARVAGLLKYFGVVVTVLLAYNLFPIAKATVQDFGADVRPLNADLQNAPRPPAPTNAPDIYYFVFDRYSGSIGLSETYGFSNEPFLQGLEQQGFYVARQSFNNYPVTSSSVASTFNAGLLQSSGPVKRAKTSKPIYRLLQRPAVARYLQDRGYQFIQIGSWWGPTMVSKYADETPKTAWEVELFGQKGHLRDLSGVFVTDTMWLDLFEKLPTSRTSLYDNHTPALWNGLAEVREISARPRPQPKLVFSHILMPHPPYVFNTDGTQGYPKNTSLHQKYLRQLQFTNKQINKMVQDILKQYPEGQKPVIVLAADEGEYPKKFIATATDAQLRQKTNILNAFYFPDGNYEALYQTITPVNTFRIILNQFLGTNFALQPDRSHTVYAVKQPLDFIDITDRIRRPPGPPGSGQPQKSSGSRENN